MSALGQSRRFDDVRVTSAFPLLATKIADIAALPKSAIREISRRSLVKIVAHLYEQKRRAGSSAATLHALAGIGGVRASIRGVAGCATPTSSACHAGTTVTPKLTFRMDHTQWGPITGPWAQIH